MDEEVMERLGDKGYRYYNCLREFYDEPDRLMILDYIIRYATEELCFENADDDRTFFEKVRVRGYSVVKQIYDANIRRLNEGRDVLPLVFPNNEQIREKLRSKYSDLEKKIKGGD